jgi:TPP-dependent 2-oxoacid decarboxylase
MSRKNFPDCIADLVKRFGNIRVQPKREAFIHHTLRTGDFQVFANMYKHVTVAQALLDRENTPTAIDRVLELYWVQKRPVYINLPTDGVEVKVAGSQRSLNLAYPNSDPKLIKVYL